MEFEAKLTFIAEALPKDILQEYLHKLVRQENQAEPVVIDGVGIYKMKTVDDLEAISLMRARGEEVSNELYIIMDELYGDEPQWLRAIHPIKINIGPIEFEKDLGVTMKVSPTPHGGGTEIRLVIDDWNNAKPLLGTYVLLDKRQICSSCGSTIIAPNGTIIVDPRVKTCLCCS